MTIPTPGANLKGGANERPASIGAGIIMDEVQKTEDHPSEILDRLIIHRAKFISFLTARVGDVATAEDILQSAYMKTMEHGSEIRDNESTVAWFYRILRNAVTDHFRRGATRTKAYEGFAADAPGSYQPELEQTVCACIGDVIQRVGDVATAEDIIQSAYMKTMEHGSEIRDNESTVAWFYRILRNAVTDHFRRGATRTKAYEGFAAEAPVSYQPELEQTVCACIADVIQNLKSEYRTAIEQVDLFGVSVETFAQEQRTTANNASVRLYRARKAVAKRLKAVCGACAEHKCLDCTCRRSQL